jgi:hypothetical protein
MLKLRRTQQPETSQYQKRIVYYLSSDTSKHSNFTLLEDSNQVDGIGGITWEGSVVLGYFMELITQFLSRNSKSIIELGAGNGLLGLLTYLLGYSVTITDRHTDLIELNYQLLMQNSLRLNGNERVDDDLLESLASLCIHSTSSIPQQAPVILPLDWQVVDNTFQFPSFDIILGAEITCLKKQHPYLINTIQMLTAVNPLAVVLLTFDDIPDKHNPRSNYEKEFLQFMKEKQYFSAVVFTGRVEWHDDGKTNQFQNAILSDVTVNYDHDLSWLSIPNNLYFPNSSPYSTTVGKDPSFDERKVEESNHDNIQYHHVVAFFKPTAVNTCSRCHKQFFRSPVFCCELLCWYHSRYYVCRKHPGETKLSIDGFGDSLGYYGNGKELWEAKFWDCCGSEDPMQPGCRKGPHIPY